ncbi:murein biosynthesis integral membrane protein MurJ [Rubricoccus marinus]|uniref:Probable lipid II flippase MurJ n=1 Tax=Rubricoccus marinus TaxID=716817 RepID=A0A259U2U8_9BACT|nr:murein biosynthesis integral membrane protein MurJ [Rubricoccus marinus]OZC04329.1 murein biosynthesis integral membrane protein MurJ [Rubricoccus marinus]
MSSTPHDGTAPEGEPLDASGGPGAVSEDSESTPEADVEAAMDAEASHGDAPPEASGTASGSDGPGSAETATPKASGAGSAAGLVAAGIFASRVIGLVRDRIIGYFFGVGAFSDVYRLGLRAPNLLQNLLGEGTLSAAFIPIYSRMVENGREEDAGRFAGAVLGLLAVVAFGVALLGVIFADAIVGVLQPGWLGDAEAFARGEIAVNRYDLAVAVVRLAFPMTAVLVLSAWALGILNSHRKFLLSYFAPVAWNVALLVALGIGAYLYFDDPLAVGALDVVPTDALSKLLIALFIGGVAGGVLQFGVQLPTVFRVMKGFRLSVSTAVPGVKEGIKAFVPVVLGRGAYQLSGYLDVFLSSFLAAGALAALGYAQTLYLLPISLFGMSVAASELPELSRISKTELSTFLERVRGSLGQILYLVIPTVVGYLAFGYLVVGVLYQTGSFGVDDTWLVYLVLAAYTVGLAATTASRLLQNAFYALDDTKTPARIAVWRVVISAIVGSALMIVFDRLSVFEVIGVASEGEPLRMGAVGLALGSAAGGWIELWRLVRALKKQAPDFTLPWGRAGRMTGLALLAAVPAGLIYAFVPVDILPIWLYGAGVLAVFGFGYLALGHALSFPEGDAWTGKFLRRLKRS